jgi:hypothetical protein
LGISALSHITLGTEFVTTWKIGIEGADFCARFASRFAELIHRGTVIAGNHFTHALGDLIPQKITDSAGGKQARRS